MTHHINAPGTILMCFMIGAIAGWIIGAVACLFGWRFPL